MTDPLSDVQLQNYLAAITDALLAGEGDIDALLAQYDLNRAEFEPFAHLIDQLGHAFVPVQPSPRFVRRLRYDLTGTDARNVLVRVRRLPPRVQIAAGIALLAGFMLLSRRRPGSEPRAEQQEVASA